jgi:UPF0716 protein FxsA
MVALVFLVGIPIVEILLLIQAGSLFGFWPTAAAVFATAALGLWLIRRQGMAAIRAARAEQAAGEIPVATILTGIRLAFAGILLLIPGFLTDAVGLLLLIPGISSGIIRTAEWRGRFRATRRHAPYGRGGETIDAEYELVTTGEPPAGRTKPGEPGGPDRPHERPSDAPPDRLRGPGDL